MQINKIMTNNKANEINGLCWFNIILYIFAPLVMK